MKAILLVLVNLLAQTNQGPDIVFHVTSVEQSEATDVCQAGKCSATRYTVAGYTRERDADVEYVLDCVEIIANGPKLHRIVECVHLHAHAEYTAKLRADSIFFPPEPSSPSDSSDADKPTLAAYTIKSEKEVRNRKK